MSSSACVVWTALPRERERAEKPWEADLPPDLELEKKTLRRKPKEAGQYGPAEAFA